MELLNGIVYLLLYLVYGLGIDSIYYGILISILIIIFFIDLDHQIIPSVLVVLILIWDIIYKFFNFLIYNLPLNLLNHLSGLAIGFVLFLLIFILSKGGIGGGDIKLIGVFGFVLGIPRIFLNMFISFVLGGIISVILLMFKKKKRKDPIAFGPFLIIGFLVSLFWGYEIIHWYIFSFY